ncbi:MAG: hypothetical protein EXR71_07320 [Myxococcales bacterium]|nr:hypothetical protein [Myxococcales bacterium]
MPIAVGVLVVALVLAPILTAPVERVLGLRYVDGFGTQWWFWYLGEVLAGRQSLTHTDLLFFPTGKDVFTHTGGNLFDALCAWPLRRILGDSLGYNTWIGVVVASNFAAGSVLGRTMSGRAGWPGGLVLAMNPFVLQELAGGRPTQAWIALPALALAGVWAARTPVAALLTGLAVAGSGWTYWYAGVLLGILAVIIGVTRLVFCPQRGRTLGVLLLAGSVAALLVAPAVAAMQEAIRAGQVPGLLALDGVGALAPLALRSVEGDATGLYVLAPLVGLSGSITGDPTPVFRGAFPALAFTGAGTLVVSSVLAWRSGRRLVVLLSLAVVLVSALVASGPMITWSGGQVVNRLWVDVVSHVDLLRRWWWPGRAIIGVYFGIAMIAPFLAELSVRGWRPLPSLMLGAAILECARTGQLPLPVWDARVPAPVLCLRGAPPGAVLDLPFLSDQRNLWFQATHRHPLLGGMLVRNADFGSGFAHQLRRDNTLLDLLLDYGEVKLTRDPTFDEADRAELVALGFRYVLLDLTRFEGVHVGRADSRFGRSHWPRLQRLLRPVLGEEAAADENAALYTLDGSELGCVVASPTP